MAFIGSTQNTANSTSITATAPALAGLGHVGYVFLTTSDADTITTPSSWLLLNSGLQGNLQWLLYRRNITAPGMSVTFSGTSSGKKAVVFAVVSEVDTSDQETGETPAASGTNTASTTRPIPGSTVSGNRQVLSFVGSRGALAPTSWTPPGGWTAGAGAYNTSSGATTAAVAYRTYTAGSVGGDNWVSDTEELRGIATLTVLTPAPVPSLKLVRPETELPKEVNSGASYVWDTLAGGILEGEYFDPYVAPPTLLAVWESSTAVDVEPFGVWESSVFTTVEALGTWESGSLVPVQT